ncbi:hypothetical protein pEaSNUABM20_00035 [Erwinia phage pEa_SNUABM_20]|nr:hypothetical protein pEaSNUABM20_00035 [Erwinia phage pEa_SNUABM_20]
MYHQLSDGASDDEVRKYYEQIHKDAEAIMQQVWALRGWTIRWEWHNGICDDCEFKQANAVALSLMPYLSRWG